MNSIPGREPRADTRDINQPKETHKRGCYLALTFGTLLSSQGADAPKLQPRGLRLGRLSMLRRLRPGFTPGGSTGRPSAPRGADKTVHHPPHLCRAPGGGDRLGPGTPVKARSGSPSRVRTAAEWRVVQPPAVCGHSPSG